MNTEIFGSVSDRSHIEFDAYIIPTNELESSIFRLLDVDNRTLAPFNIHVRILIRSADVLHAWTVPSLGVKADAVPGRLNQVKFIRQRPGVSFGQSATPTKVSSIETLAAAAAATASNEESSNYSSLLDIGQAYGIWNPSEDNSNDMSGPRDLKIVEDEEDEIPTDKDTPEPLKIEYQEPRVESSTPTGLRESSNNNNVATEKSLAAAAPS